MAMYPCLSLPSLSFPTLTGSIVTFNSQYAGLPLKSHTVALTATQSGSGTPSPTNPRPITGYSAINISHSDADTFNPTVYTITIGSTVYGGEYDARTGVLTVTHGFATFDGSNDEVWYTSGSAAYTEITDAKITNSYGDAITNSYNEVKNWTAVTLSTQTNYIFCIYKNVAWPKARLAFNLVGRTLSDFISDIQTNNIEVVYELATPQTIQLPAFPVDTLEGVNNIWADTGDTTLQYPKFG